MPYTQVGGSTEFFEDYLTFQSDVVPLFSVFKSIVTITKTGTGSNQINIKPKPKKYSEASHSPASTPIPSPPVRKHLYIFFKGIFCVSTHLSTLETSPFSGLKKKNASRRHLLEPVGQYYIPQQGVSWDDKAFTCFNKKKKLPSETAPRPTPIQRDGCYG